MEPIDAYARLRRNGAVLLDGMGDHPAARYAYVATGFAYHAILNGNELTIQHTDGQTEVKTGAPLQLIANLANEMRQDVDEPEGFTGGLVGYFGYEFSRVVEPSLPSHAADTPDAVLWLAQDAIVFDRHNQTAWAWLNGVGNQARAVAVADDLRSKLPASPAQGPPETWQTSISREEFHGTVETLRQRIHAGDLYQANLATRFTTKIDADPVALYRKLARDNPSPFMALIEADDHTIVSCSPEQLFSVQAGIISTRPIAGTVRRGATPAADAENEAFLLTDPKEQAEHTMLVDLLRNDIAKVSQPGSVVVDEKMSTERYRSVIHLVSSISGKLRNGTGFTDWLTALFPGGTITGTPKHRAALRIYESEPIARGPYTGSAGFLSWSHNTHWNIMIRTIVLKGNELRIHAGSGIVADSDPEREWKELSAKAEALVNAASDGVAPTTDKLGTVVKHGTWQTPLAEPIANRRVFIVDNFDSFTYNLADYCSLLGAEVLVVRNDADVLGELAAFAPTHVIIGPGPGRPEDSAGSLDVLGHFDGPTLGVCLGHQAMAMTLGSAIVRTGPVHGKQATMAHAGTGLLANLPSPLLVARYHSLGLSSDGLTGGWVLDARLDDGTVMAMHRTDRSWFGLQFHPESIASEHGLPMIRKFLEAR
jgi:anthranilate synthase